MQSQKGAHSMWRIPNSGYKNSLLYPKFWENWVRIPNSAEARVRAHPVRRQVPARGNVSAHCRVAAPPPPPGSIPTSPWHDVCAVCQPGCQALVDEAYAVCVAHPLHEWRRAHVRCIDAPCAGVWLAAARRRATSSAARTAALPRPTPPTRRKPFATR